MLACKDKLQLARVLSTQQRETRWLSTSYLGEMTEH